MDDNETRACVCGETVDLPRCIWCGWSDPRISPPATDGSS